MERRTWMYVAIIAVMVSICVVALWWAGATPFALTGNVVKVPLTGTWTTAAADGVDVYRFAYTSGGVYIYSVSYNTSVGLAAVGQSGYLIYPVWNKRVVFTWAKTAGSYAYVRMQTS